MSDAGEILPCEAHPQSTPAPCSLCSTEHEQLIECESCQSQICEDCTAYALICSHARGKGEYQVCSACFAKISKLSAFLVAEEIKWCSLTPRGAQWFEVCGARAWSSKQLPITEYENVSMNPEDREMIEKDVDSGRSNPGSFNRELQETLLRVVGESYMQDIKRVLSAYCVKNKNVGYCQGMNVVTVWLLIFFDHNTAFLMLCYLIEKWLLPDLYIGGKHGNSMNGFYIESTVIAGLLEYFLPVFRDTCITANEFSDFFSLRHLIEMFVGTVDIETTVFLWDMLCREGSIALIRGIVSLVVISEKDVRMEVHPQYILKNITEHRIAPQVKEAYLRLQPEINSARVEKLRKLARDYRAKEWQKCEKMVLDKLEHLSKFSGEEIGKLQEQFNHLMRTRKNSKDYNKYLCVKLMRHNTVNLPHDLQKQMEDYRGSNTVGITKDEFVVLLSRIAPDQTSSASSLFDTFDEDRSGYLDFRELTIAMSVISDGDFEDKLRICFDAYDSDHSGYLQMIELQILIEDILRPYSQVIGNEHENKEIKDSILKIHTKMMQLCEKFHGKIAFYDFLNAIKADMMLYNCICEYLGMKKQGARRVMNAIQTGTILEGESKCRFCDVCGLF